MKQTKFFLHPKTPGQKQYEALRAFYVEHIPGTEIIRRYGYTNAAFNSLKQRFKSGDLEFFMTPPRGPKAPRMSHETRSKIIEYRQQGVSAGQIAEILDTLGTPISISSVARVLDQEGFPKLPRRTQLKIGLTKDNTIVPSYAAPLRSKDFENWKAKVPSRNFSLCATHRTFRSVKAHREG